jgi:glutaredoxin-like YruB-family protein
MANVLVYSTSTCPHCKSLKKYLDEKGVEYTDYDVATDAAKRKEMVEKSGQMGVPVLDIDGRVIAGFEKADIDNALGI